MYLTLIVTDRHDVFVFFDFHAGDQTSVHQEDIQRFVAWCHRATRFEYRFDQVDTGKTAADTCQVRTDTARFITDPMALDAL